MGCRSHRLPEACTPRRVATLRAGEGAFVVTALPFVNEGLLAAPFLCK